MLFRSPRVSAQQSEIKGKSVWLVHPWALRAPPADMPKETVVIGVYLREHHDAWPWPHARWEWVDAAMANVTTRRWWTDTASLAAALSDAASVRSSDDPHITRWLKPLAHLDAAPSLFPPVAQRCKSPSRNPFFAFVWCVLLQQFQRSYQSVSPSSICKFLALEFKL